MVLVCSVFSLRMSPFTLLTYSELGRKERTPVFCVLLSPVREGGKGEARAGWGKHELGLTSPISHTEPHSSVSNPQCLPSPSVYAVMVLRSWEFLVFRCCWWGCVGTCLLLIGSALWSPGWSRNCYADQTGLQLRG